ncbi:MAG: tripartite tricarboxylate transporter TctB family protein [Kiloniellales bacterium]
MSGEGPGKGTASGFGALLHRTDLGLAAFILAFCAFLFYVTTTFEEVSNLFAQDIPPEFFPRLVLYFIVALTVWLPFEHISHKKRGEDIDSERAKKVRPMPYYTGLLLIGIVFFMPWLGTTLCMVATCVLLPILWGERRWKVILPFAILFPAVVTFVFNRLLLVYFQPGPLDLVRY